MMNGHAGPISGAPPVHRLAARSMMWRHFRQSTACGIPVTPMYSLCPQAGLRSTPNPIHTPCRVASQCILHLYGGFRSSAMAASDPIAAIYCAMLIQIGPSLRDSRAVLKCVSSAATGETSAENILYCRAVRPDAPPPGGTALLFNPQAAWS